MFGDDDEAKVDRVMSEYSYRRESDDMWDNLILYLFYAAVAVVGILALLGWLDHQLGWHMKDQFVAWLKGAVQIKAMSAGYSILPCEIRAAPHRGRSYTHSEGIRLPPV